jgi:small subunit ribosomal protein S35
MPDFRKPFEPPTSNEPLVIRSIEYMGEHHPAAAKQAIVAPVARLPLRDAEAIHKFKLLAGVNWSEQPPRDAGIGPEEESGEHGYVKISTETFPEQAMNLKWGSDVLDRLIEEANDVRYFFVLF